MADAPMGAVRDTAAERGDATPLVPAAPADKRSGTRPLSRRERFIADLLEGTGVAGEVRLADGTLLRCGDGAPRFRVTLHRDDALRRGLDELSLGRAYVEGDLDLEGDLLALFDVRKTLARGIPWSARLNFLVQLLLRPPSWVNRKAIHHHYTLGDEFYLSFIDRRWRFYSHGIFHDEAETLEEASTHKLETMFRALDLKPGMRLLDIGGGWGGALEYCAERGVEVTSLTLAEDSQRYLTRLIEERSLPARVLFQDFLQYRPEQPYDAVVIYGVIEHIPNYRHFCRRAWECLAPGGRLYMDASASKEKFDMSAFTRHYIWHGTHTFLSLQDIVQEFLFHGFQVLEVADESRDYELTMRHWAERFDAARDTIVERWGEQVYRAFRIYLWGGCHAFREDNLQAYHLVVRKGVSPGPRPGLLRRAGHFVRGLA